MTEKIKIMLVKRKMSAADLAKILECSPTNIYNKLKRDNFSEKALKQIADILNSDCDLMIFKGNISCYILLLKSSLTLENTKFIAGELSLKVSLVLYLPTRLYKP